MTVTSTPKSHSMEAHSIPMTPPPTISMEAGSCSSSSASSDDSTFSPSSSSPGSDLDLEPVAMMTFFGMSISFSSPFAISTETVPGIGEKIDGPRIRPIPS